MICFFPDQNCKIVIVISNFQSHSIGIQELQRRCNTLITLIEKEMGEVEVKPRPRKEKSTAAGGGAGSSAQGASNDSPKGSAKKKAKTK